MADEAADMAEEAAASAIGAAAEAASAIGAAAGAAAASSGFLPQAARATAATRDANRSDFFIFFLSERFGQLPVIVGTLHPGRSPTNQGAESSSISCA
jgi:hypothetical protein